MFKTKKNKGSTGSDNSGNWNSGNWNSGNLNSGDWNSGSLNSGDLNSGSLNSGSWNSGDLNSGSWNSGSWNSGDRNSGYLNSEKDPFIYMFNKKTEYRFSQITSNNAFKIPNYFYNVSLTEWINPSEMTDKEKKQHPFYETTNGYLKKNDYKQAWRKAFNNADTGDKALTLRLPNFDVAIFYEITGINMSEENFEGNIFYKNNNKFTKVNLDVIEINGVKYRKIDS